MGYIFNKLWNKIDKLWDIFKFSGVNYFGYIFSKLWNIFLANYEMYFDKLWDIISAVLSH